MNFWMFKATPEHYRIDERLLNPYPMITWAVTRYHDRIQKGDTAFLWRAGTPRGICAVMTIEACPYQPTQEELHDGFNLPAGLTAPDPDHWAKCKILQRFPIIESSVIKKIPGLELFSFFSAFPQAINFTLNRPEGTILLEFIEAHQAEWKDKKLEIVPPKPAPKLKKPAPAVRPGIEKKTKPSAPAAGPTGFDLLKCDICGRYVVRSDTARHTQEVHDGLPVDWKKVR